MCVCVKIFNLFSSCLKTSAFWFIFFLVYYILICISFHLFVSLLQTYYIFSSPFSLLIELITTFILLSFSALMIFLPSLYLTYFFLLTHIIFSTFYIIVEYLFFFFFFSLERIHLLQQDVLESLLTIYTKPEMQKLKSQGHEKYI